MGEYQLQDAALPDVRHLSCVPRYCANTQRLSADWTMPDYILVVIDDIRVRVNLDYLRSISASPADN